jgi:hypothetical protein
MAGLLGGFGGGVVGGATVRLLLDDTQFRAGLTSAEAQTKQASTTMGAFGGAGKAAFLGLGIAATAFGVAGVKALEHFQQSQAQTAAVLKSTGGAAGVTASEVAAYARQLGESTGIQDDAIQSAENMILTFRNIRNEQGKGNDIFNQTTQAVLDMATAMNGGAIPSAEQLRKTSIQLGKALNDPTIGLTALRRVGVTFSDSQTTLIKTLYTTGHALEAQKLVLQEVTKEFGGSAKAAGDTMAGAMGKLDNALRPVLIEVGQSLLPIFKALGDTLRAITPILEVVGPAFAEIAVALGAYKALSWVIGLFQRTGAAASQSAVQMQLFSTETQTVRSGLSGLRGILGLATAGFIAYSIGQQMSAKEQQKNTEAAQALFNQVSQGAVSLETYQKDIAAAAAELPGFAQGQFQATYGVDALTKAMGGFLPPSADVIAAQEKQRQQAAALVVGYEALYGSTEGAALGYSDLYVAQQKAFAIRGVADAFFGSQITNLKDLRKAYAGWKSEAAGDLNFVTGALQDFSGKTHVNIGHVITDFQKSSKQMNQFGNDLESIRQRGGKAADGLVQSLLSMGDQGIGVAHAIATANDQQFGKVVGTWNKAGGQAQSFAGQIEHALAGGFNRIAAAILIANARATTFAQALDILNGKKVDITITTTYVTKGAPPSGTPAAQHIGQIAGK